MASSQDCAGHGLAWTIHRVMRECGIWNAGEYWLQSEDEAGVMRLSCFGPLPFDLVKANCAAIGLRLVVFGRGPGRGGAPERRARLIERAASEHQHEAVLC